MADETQDHTAALVAHWKQLGGDVTVPLTGVSATGAVGSVHASLDVTLEDAILAAEGVVGTELKTAGAPRGISVGVALLVGGSKTEDGQLILAVTPAWRRILNEAANDPKALYQLNDRQFEEFNAGAYEQEGWTVTLTRRSGDRGRDIIAHRPEFGGLRLLVQVKQLKPGNRVTAEEVRALSWVLVNDQAASKAVFTTTSEFTPGVHREFTHLIPTRLDLRDGAGLQAWLKQIRGA
jgi:restriction system protein